MKFLLMTWVSESRWTELTDAEKERGVAAYAAYMDALAKSGVLEGSGRLQPTSTACTVRTANGETQVLDGPYAESKEQLGGYFLIDVPDRAAALACAKRCPAAAHGVVEVRPLWVMAG